jgi:hypothetical protein
LEDTLGFLLHPDIKLPEDANIEIADIGTGTGYASESSHRDAILIEGVSNIHRIWLTDLKSQLSPKAPLDGFDISADQCPPAEWVPENITLQTLDALAGVPEELIGKYDVDHLRLFVVVVQNGDPGPLIRNAVKMLSESNAQIQPIANS